MIAVYADKLGGKYRLLVEGHAGEDGEGSLVCAAVSALTGALVEYAKSNPACRHLRASVDKGRVFLSCRYGLGNAFDMTALALAKLAAIYPQHMAYYRGQKASPHCEKKR